MQNNRPATRRAGKLGACDLRPARGGQAGGTTTKTETTGSRGGPARVDTRPIDDKLTLESQPPRRQEVKTIATRKKDEVRELAVAMTRLLDDKLAKEVVILDMREVTYLTDYFIIVTARNRRHTQSLADDLSRFIKERGNLPVSVEGLGEGRWVLFDCGDVVVHLFDEETRKFYDLDHLWSDASRVRWKLPRKVSGPVTKLDS